jgi:hypothetical protein
MMKDEDSESQLLLIMIGFLAYLTLPILFGTGLYLALILGEFPQVSDSHANPLVGFLLLWISGLVFAFVLGALHVTRTQIARCIGCDREIPTVDAHVVDNANRKYTPARYGEAALEGSIFHKRNYSKLEVSR